MKSALKVTFRADLAKVDKLDRDIVGRVGHNLKAVCEDTVGIIKASWSPYSPSDPYNPPAVVTGTLDRSVRVERTGRAAGGRFAAADNAVSWSVVAGAFYAPLLEYGTVKMKKRPFFEPAVSIAFNRVPNAVKDAIIYLVRSG